MSLFAKFLQSNKSFWSDHSNKGTGNGLALIDTSINDSYLLYGIMKVGLIFSKIHNLEPIALPYPSTRNADLAVIKSMFARTIPIKRKLLAQFFLKFSNLGSLIDGARESAFWYSLLKINSIHREVAGSMGPMPFQTE